MTSKVQQLYYCGLNVFLTDIAKWPHLRLDRGLMKKPLVWSYQIWLRHWLNLNFWDLKIISEWLESFLLALQIWMPHPVQPNSTVILLVLKTLFRLLSLYNLVVLLSGSPLYQCSLAPYILYKTANLGSKKGKQLSM